MDNFIKNLKEGDTVIVSGRFATKLSSVIRTTATQIIVEGGSKFRKDNGNAVGGGDWCTTSLREATPDAVYKVVQDNRRIKIKSLIQSDILNVCTDDEVLKIWNVLREKTIPKGKT